nr:polysulfide reductase NrfD [Saprospiraceae bacterium]
TKAISAGAFLVPFLALVFSWASIEPQLQWWGLGLGLLFLVATGVLLVMDLDQPKRFAYVLLRPHWGSWLVKGGYSITLYGGLLTLIAAALFFDWTAILKVASWLTAVAAVVVAIYTAFLFAQAKGRDFWQSPSLALHMLVHSLMAGAAAFAVLTLFLETSSAWDDYLAKLLYATIGFNLLTLLLELTTTHPTEDAKRTVHMITKGRYARLFYLGVILLGNLLPVGLLSLGDSSMFLAGAGVLILLGIYFTEHIWVEAPQRIPLT